MSEPFVIPWTVAHQAPLSMGFSRQEYWSGLPFPSPADLLDASLSLTGAFFTTEPPGKPQVFCCCCSVTQLCQHTAHRTTAHQAFLSFTLFPDFAQIHVQWGILLLAAKCTLNNRAIHFDHWEYQQQRPCWDQMLTGQEPEYFLNKCEMVF